MPVVVMSYPLRVQTNATSKHTLTISPMAAKTILLGGNDYRARDQ